MNAQDVAATLEQRVRTSANADGGWSYFPGRSSRLEPTAWALLALDAVHATGSPQDLSRHRGYFAGLQSVDGLLVEAAGIPPNIGFNGLLTLLLSAQPQLASSEIRHNLHSALLRTKGAQLEQHPASPMNNRLQAWPWLDTTFSWIEPTAFCTLAFKRTRMDEEASRRVRDAEGLLFDRVCSGGGWNFGNAEVFGSRLRPYVPTTALALLALQDHPKHPAVAKSVDWLTRNRGSEASAMALSLVAIALTVFGVPAADVIDSLVQAWQRTSFLDNNHLTAMALYGITCPIHHARAFTLAAHPA
jgi:hypothetical protein